MALYDDYLNNNNLYSRPSSLMSDVNDYLGANSAKLPIDDTTLGSMAGLNTGVSTKAGGMDPGHKAYGLGTGQTLGGHTPGANISGKDPGLLSDFIDKVSALNAGQQQLLLGYIGETGGDNTAGVSAEEWVELFGLDPSYANRFQGFPTLLDMTDDIRNVFAGGEQKRGYEVKSAQEAMIQAANQQRAGGLRMGGTSNAIMRRQMEDTLEQRLFATQEDTASKYSQLIAGLNASINRGFGIAGDILNMNPEAASGARIDPNTGELITYGGDDGLTNRDTTRATRRN